MQRIALSCRPTQSLENIIRHGFAKGVRVFDTPFIPLVPATLKSLYKPGEPKPRILLRTTEDSKDALEFQIRTFISASGSNVDITIMTQDPEYNPESNTKNAPSPREKMENIFQILQNFSTVGYIKGFGVSSNGLATGTLQINDIDAANPGPGFCLIQFPYNLLERGAKDSPVVPWAKARSLEICGNRALTAFDESGSWRFAECQFPPEYVTARDELITHLTPPVSASADEKAASQWMLNLINRLDEQLSQFTSVIHWEMELSGQIIPMIDKEVEEIDAKTHQLLTTFLHYFGLAVKESGGFLAREHLLAQRPELLGLESFRSTPLHEYALRFALSNRDLNLISIHASNESQLDDLERIISTT